MERRAGDAKMTLGHVTAIYPEIGTGGALSLYTRKFLSPSRRRAICFDCSPLYILFFLSLSSSLVSDHVRDDDSSEQIIFFSLFVETLFSLLLARDRLTLLRFCGLFVWWAGLLRRSIAIA